MLYITFIEGLRSSLLSIVLSWIIWLNCWFWSLLLTPMFASGFGFCLVGESVLLLGYVSFFASVLSWDVIYFLAGLVVWLGEQVPGLICLGNRLDRLVWFIDLSLLDVLAINLWAFKWFGKRDFSSYHHQKLWVSKNGFIITLISRLFLIFLIADIPFGNKPICIILPNLWLYLSLIAAILIYCRWEIVEDKGLRLMEWLGIIIFWFPSTIDYKWILIVTFSIVNMRKLILRRILNKIWAILLLEIGNWPILLL